MGRQIRQWIACLSCTLSVALCGTCYAWITPLMAEFTSPKSPIPMTKSDASWVASIIGLGAVFTAIPAGILADRWGRKTMLLVTGPLSIISWIIIINTRSLPFLLLARFLQSMNISLTYTIAPMYIAEVSEPKIRGLLSGQFQSMWFIGQLYAFCTGPYLSYNMYALVCAIIPVLFQCTFCFVPESPYYLIMIKKDEKAKKSLTWLRGNEEVATEFEDLKRDITKEMENRAGWKDLFATKRDITGLLKVQLVSVVRFLSGMSAISIYATETFEAELGHMLRSHELTIILGVILVITTILASLGSDKIGRKPLLIISSAGTSVFYFVIAIIYFLESNTAIDVSSYKWITFVSLLFACIISNIGLGPLMMTIQAEYFTSHTRAKGSGITQAIAAFLVVVSIKQYQLLTDYFGVYMNYFVFFLVTFFGAILFLILLPETSGNKLGNIDDCKVDVDPKTRV